LAAAAGSGLWLGAVIRRQYSGKSRISRTTFGRGAPRRQPAGHFRNEKGGFAAALVNSDL